ncbi:MAG: MFS transporter [Myxococcota bacterium]
MNWLNFFAADASDGIGPFLATYLISTSHWDESSVGVVLLTLNLATVIAQTPAGFAIDRTRHKRVLIATACTVIAGCVLVPAVAPERAPVLISCALIGVAAAIVPPAISAVTLGIVGPDGFTRQTGSNQAFNHAGNFFAATAIGVTAYLVIDWALFPVVAALAACAALTVLRIPERTIRHDVARGGFSEGGGDADGPTAAEGLRRIASNRPLMIFMVSVALFHLANAPMLPLAGQNIAKNHQELATVYMSVCVIVAQIVMIGVAALIGARSERWGRKPFLLLGFGVLPLRGLWFSQVENPYLVILGQVLDGVGAGVYGVIVFLVVADLTRGSGIYNFATSVVITLQGLGASLGSWVGEVWAGSLGYSMAFALLTGLAVVALTIIAVFMPETRAAPANARAAPT